MLARELVLIKIEGMSENLNQKKIVQKNFNSVYRETDIQEQLIMRPSLETCLTFLT